MTVAPTPTRPGLSQPFAPLVDRFARVHTDLRVSVTDRCPLRCRYCLPPSGLVPRARWTLLTTDEIVRVVAVAVACGVTKVRLTGGEPLVRPDLVDLVARLADLAPRPELCLTTSGIGLAERASVLAAAGLDRVTVSLDTLDPDEYARLTGRRRLDEVLAGIAALRSAGFTRTKVNAVMVRGLTERAAPALVGWALAAGLELRFIEQMPLGGSPWRREDLLTAAELLARLGTRHRLTAAPDRSGAPATRYRVDDGPAHIGIIAAVTRPFCGDCSRLRLTADGQLRSCLFATDELDLRTVLRDGAATDEQVAQALARCVTGKAAGHGIGREGFRPPVRLMRAIGG
ncbi:MAG: GTP 3',8-cyclase MoaA [Micrococcales bacterium]|nr:GTP 3',8-cyclase MoaA [Micrococcales bacterium]